MKTLTDLQADIVNLDTAVKANAAAISDASTRISADLQALKDKIAAGDPDVTDQVASIENSIAAIQASTAAVTGHRPAAPPTTPTAYDPDQIQRREVISSWHPREWMPTATRAYERRITPGWTSPAT